jgi:hypothetical protein
MRTGLAALVITACLLACAKGERPAAPAADTLTQRQRDSAVDASKLPGAQGVGRAQAVQDSAAARNAQLDSIR